MWLMINFLISKYIARYSSLKQPLRYSRAKNSNYLGRNRFHVIYLKLIKCNILKFEVVINIVSCIITVDCSY